VLVTNSLREYFNRRACVADGTWELSCIKKKNSMAFRQTDDDDLLNSEGPRGKGAK
jgi:hypothetical protein